MMLQMDLVHSLLTFSTSTRQESMEMQVPQSVGEKPLYTVTDSDCMQHCFISAHISS